MWEINWHVSCLMKYIKFVLLMITCIFFKYNNYYRKIFGCLHNSLHKLLKNTDKKNNLNTSECPSIIDIRIKCLSSREKDYDPHLKVNLFILVLLLVLWKC